MYSGVGRELGRYGIEEFQEPRAFCKWRNIKESPEVCFRGFAKVFGRVFGKGLGYEHSRIVHQQVDSSIASGFAGGGWGIK